MGNTTTYGDINQRTAAFASREMLRHAEPVFILSKMGTTKAVPKGTASSVRFRRPRPFPVSLVPLMEGVTPTPQKLQYEDVSVNLKQYGALVEFSDWVIQTSEDPVLRDSSMLIGQQAGATLEQIIYSAVRGGTNVVYANGATRGAVNTAITLNKQRAVTRQLMAQKARPITRIVDSTPDYLTKPVEAAFVAVAHTDLGSDIRNLPGFIPTAQYGSKRLVSDYEIGSVEDVRYVLSPDLAPITANTNSTVLNGMLNTTIGGTAYVNVYPVIYFGMDSFAQVPLKGEDAMTPIVVNPKPSASDPLGQRGYVGYKFATAALILNELWLCRLEVAATAL